MNSNALVSATELADMIEARLCIVFDCRFDLAHRQQGYHSWLASHIPGALYAHLDDDLAGRVTRDSGRHPLPHPRSFAAFLARSGWQPGIPIVAYDAAGGAFAARLWWLMRYFGHDCVSLLDGGMGAWRRALLPLESGPVDVQRSALPTLKADASLLLTTAQVQRGLDHGELVLVDARAHDRFRGENEAIDPVAGHVPGARNRPFHKNLDSQGCFRDPDTLKSDYRAFGPGLDGATVVHMCGSGVTACHNLFAMDLAGLEGSRLYVGSWSEWIRDPQRPVAVGPD